MSKPTTTPNSHPSSIPLPGLGVYKIRGEACTTACLAALAAGYRHVDTAQLYQNEAQVGEAVRQSGVRRDDLFLTTKITPIAKPGRMDTDNTYQSAVESVTRLAGEHGYVDLFLIHVPGSSRPQREELWGVLEGLRGEGKVRSIGVSNFRQYHIEEMKEYATVWPPAVNQIEVKTDSTQPSCPYKANITSPAPSMVSAKGPREILPAKQHSHRSI